MIIPNDPKKPDDELLKELLQGILVDLDMATTILQVHQKLDLSQRLIEATLAVKNVYDVTKRGWP